MPLQILSSTPNSNTVNQPLDSVIQLEFSQAIDPFSIPNGISIYTINSSSIKGPLASELDVNTEDVNTKFDDIRSVEYSYSVSGNIVTLTPVKALESETKYYIQVTPGNNPLRFLTTETVSNIIYTKATTGSNAEINITSPYTGNQTGTYTLTFTSETNIDVSFEGIYKDSYIFNTGEELSIDKNIALSITAGFEAGDTVEFDVIPAQGVQNIYKISFTTSSYTTAPVLSTRIEDKLYRQYVNDLKAVSISPPSFSINNTRCNPIIIKFNRAIPGQDFSNKIRVHKLNIETGAVKRIVHYTKLAGDTLKVYLVSVDSASEISETLAYSLMNDTPLKNYNIV